MEETERLLAGQADVTIWAKFASLGLCGLEEVAGRNVAAALAAREGL